MTARVCRSAGCSGHCESEVFRSDSASSRLTVAPNKLVPYDVGPEGFIKVFSIIVVETRAR